MRQLDVSQRHEKLAARSEKPTTISNNYFILGKGNNFYFLFF